MKYVNLKQNQKQKHLLNKINQLKEIRIQKMT